MLVVGRQKVVPIPHEDGQSVTIKALSWKKLNTAQRKQQSEGIDFMKEIGGELIKALREGDSQQVKKIEEAQEANIRNYDRNDLLVKGLVTWSYEEELNEENIGELDEETAAFLAQVIFDFSRGETKVEAGKE